MVDFTHGQKCTEVTGLNGDCTILHISSVVFLSCMLLNIGSIRIYILMTGVVSNETNTYVRMYIEEFILVDIWIHCCTKLK